MPASTAAERRVGGIENGVRVLSAVGTNECAQRRVSAAETARDILIGGGEGGGILLCTIKMALVRRSVIPAVMRQLFFVVLEVRVCILGSTSVSRPSQSYDMKFDFFIIYFLFLW